MPPNATIPQHKLCNDPVVDLSSDSLALSTTIESIKTSENAMLSAPIANRQLAVHRLSTTATPRLSVDHATHPSTPIKHKYDFRLYPNKGIVSEINPQSGFTSHGSDDTDVTTAASEGDKCNSSFKKKDFASAARPTTPWTKYTNAMADVSGVIGTPKSVFCVVVADVEDAFVAVVLVVVVVVVRAFVLLLLLFVTKRTTSSPRGSPHPEKLPRGLVKDEDEEEDATRRARSRPPFLSTPFAPVIARGRRHTRSDIIVVVVVVIVRVSIRPPKVRILESHKKAPPAR